MIVELCIVQLAVVRQVLRKELGLKIVEVESDKALVEGGDVLWTGKSSIDQLDVH